VWSSAVHSGASGYSKSSPRKREQLLESSPALARTPVLAAGRCCISVYALVLALTSGLRQGALAGVRWEGVDLEGRQPEVRRPLQHQDGMGWLEQRPKRALSAHGSPSGWRPPARRTPPKDAQESIILPHGQGAQAQVPIPDRDHRA
jgi:hypothetical protein